MNHGSFIPALIPLGGSGGGSIGPPGKDGKDGENGKDGGVYVPHIDDHNVLTFTFEERPNGSPPPVDLNPNDEWSEIGDEEVTTDYIWESL